MTEHLPPSDLFTEAQSYDSFDAWLSGIPDERLQQVANAIAQENADPLTDDDTFHHLVNIAMHFRSSEGMTVQEAAKAYQALAAQVGFEVNVRNGILEKEGEYSMRPDGSARFTVTDKGRERYGGGDVV